MSTPRSSAYLDAVTLEIEKKLQRALASPTQRRNLLQELFADIALEIDERAKDMILSREEDAISPAEDSMDGQLCFYDVLTDHYVQVPASGKRILDLIVQLWSQSFASHIFALLFHKWLFEVQLDNSEVLLRYSSALIEGATNVFWYGYYFCSHTALNEVYIFFTGQLQKLKVEPVLLHYLSHIKLLQGMDLRMATSTRLKACLYSFTSPGGPMYPTRAVRHAAWDALDLLFPVSIFFSITVSVKTGYLAAFCLSALAVSSSILLYQEI
ncbi:hypothetical protein GBA52_021166 [Prunus armeniaca]|nr:hypothetical protein GBA52_021166 [Prunus armeniaca]